MASGCQRFLHMIQLVFILFDVCAALCFAVSKCQWQRFCSTFGELEHQQKGKSSLLSAFVSGCSPHLVGFVREFGDATKRYFISSRFYLWSCNSVHLVTARLVARFAYRSVAREDVVFVAATTLYNSGYFTKGVIVLQPPLYQLQLHDTFVLAVRPDSTSIFVGRRAKSPLAPNNRQRFHYTITPPQQPNQLPTTHNHIHFFPIPLPTLAAGRQARAPPPQFWYFKGGIGLLMGFWFGMALA